MNASLANGGVIGVDATILILSDIHGNWPALQAVIRAEPTATDVVCLGDLVNYGPNPAECVRWMMRNVPTGRALAGNHDLLAVNGGQPEFSRESRQVMDAVLRHTRARLSHSERAGLAALPAQTELWVGQKRWRACHGLPSDPVQGYLLCDAPMARWKQEIESAGRPFVLLVGHTHRPFRLEIDGTTVVNPGSVGRPKDGDHRAAYAVWRAGEFVLKKVDYPLDEVARQLADIFPPEIARRLQAPLIQGDFWASSAHHESE